MCASVGNFSKAVVSRTSLRITNHPLKHQRPSSSRPWAGSSVKRVGSRLNVFQMYPFWHLGTFLNHRGACWSLLSRSRCLAARFVSAEPR